MPLVWKRESCLVKEYDLFIPLFYNDGTPIEVNKFQDLQYSSHGNGAFRESERQSE
jgi:hypothetical protein